MRKSLLVLISMVAVASWGVMAASAQTTAPKVPDLSGVWRVKDGPKLPGTRQSERGGRDISVFSLEMPMQPWAQKRCQEIGCAQGINSANVPTGRVYDETADPVLMKCAPYGFPRAILGGFEILQVPGRVIMHFQAQDELRQIWTDGRSLPKVAPTDAAWMGYSVGHWEGDTLVVETFGFNDLTWLDTAGHPHSEDMRVTEHIRRTDPKNLRIDLMIDDPKTYTAPIRGTIYYDLEPKAELGENLRCEDRVVSDDPEDAWPYFKGDFPKPAGPPFVYVPPKTTK